MFDPKKDLMTRLADAVDLAMDFATLGEYGLEPVARAPRCERRARQARRGRPRRHVSPGSTGRLGARA